MSNWRVFSESQDEKPQTEHDFEFRLSQRPAQPPLPLSSAISRERPEDVAGSSCPPKQARIEKQWHGNLDREARAMVILLQVGCVEAGTKDVTFEGCFEGLNVDQYFCMATPVEGSRGHQRWLEGLVNPLLKANRAEYVATTIKRILEILQME